MESIWKPNWYELDQSIIVGDIDYFYLSRELNTFVNGSCSDNDIEVKAEIMSIRHEVLGEIKGILAVGLDYTIYLMDNSTIMVNAEENPGEIYNSSFNIDEWAFIVDINIIEKTGFTSKSRRASISKKEQIELNRLRTDKYKQLLIAEIN